MASGRRKSVPGSWGVGLIDRYITFLASALTANVTREAKRGTSIESPVLTDTAKRAHIASPETAVKAHVHKKRVLSDKALHSRAHSEFRIQGLDEYQLVFGVGDNLRCSGS